jgi:hypothetical protein
MEPDRPSGDSLLARYGAIAYRLAYAIVGDVSAAERAVIEAAGATGPAYAAGATDSVWAGREWVVFLEQVRSRALALRPAVGETPAGSPPTLPTIPLITDPGDTSPSPLPIEAFAVYGALGELAAEDRRLLLAALVGAARTGDGADTAAGGPAEELARALERLSAALAAQNFPSAEDIP